MRKALEHTFHDFQQPVDPGLVHEMGQRLLKGSRRSAAVEFSAEITRRTGGEGKDGVKFSAERVRRSADRASSSGAAEPAQSDESPRVLDLPEMPAACWNTYASTASISRMA